MRHYQRSRWLLHFLFFLFGHCLHFCDCLFDLVVVGSKVVPVKLLISLCDVVLGLAELLDLFLLYQLDLRLYQLVEVDQL